MITRVGVMSVILSEDLQRVLLNRRELFWLWELPGGGVEKNETLDQAAGREVREETGYEIRVERLVGQYLHQSVYGAGDQMTTVFRAHIVGGNPKHFGLETTGLKWFSVQQLPFGLQPLQRQMVADALAVPAAPFERRIDFPRWQLYPARLAFFGMRWRNYLLRKLIKNIRNRGN